MTATKRPDTAYPYYLTASGLWMAGMSLQGFLFTWLLVGVLERPAAEAGFARSLAEFPPLAVLFLGGLLGDRVDGRTYLGWMHVLMTLPPLMIAAVYLGGALNYWWVVLFGVLMAAVQALSDPARQALLSRVARMDIQRAVTIMTIFTSLVGLTGFYVGGHLNRLGLTSVLLIQATMFFLGLFAVRRLPPLPMSPSAPQPIAARLTAGVRAIWQTPLVRNIIGLNFLSSLFNAGAYIIAVPYIVKEVYLGDAAFFATVMIIFTAGSISSNMALLPFMPLKFPGRLFLTMQVTRVVILTVLWLQPSLWLFYGAILAWGMNMGVSGTMVRTTVQELAEPRLRAQVLSVLLLSFMVSSPISATLLGLLISATSPLTALLPGIAVSALIFVLGLWRSGLWQYQAPAPHRLPAAG